jgi:hypothetical protein
VFWTARLGRLVVALTFVAVALLAARPAEAWVERTVKSDAVTVDLARDGTAVVTHEILLFVRGAPLPEFSVDPVDADAELLEGATVTRAQAGRAAGLPLPLAASREGTKVTLRVIGDKGIHGGTHQIRFSYRTNLAGAGKVQPRGRGTLLEWQGPSFPDGIDSARVVFRLPRASAAPRVGSAETTEGAGVADERDGVFLTTFRRVADKDELELVRPHMARGESVAWRATVDASTFDVSAPPSAELEAPVVVAPPAAHAAARPVPSRGPLPVVAGLVALAYAVVVALKSRWVTLACLARRATPRPLLPIGTPLRAALAAAGIAGAVAGVVLALPPLLAAASLVVTLAAATHLPPRTTTPLRGPGKWVPLTPEVAFDAGPASPRLPGRFVDAGSPLGFVLFTALLGLFVAAAVTAMRSSTYYGVTLALGSAILFPIFCTGRAGELPPDPVAAPRELLDWLMEQLGKDAGLVLSPLGRLPHAGGAHDELRLLVTLKRATPGFVAIEVGLDFHQGVLGLLALPFVLVRVSEGSESAEALPKGLLWTRGRNADERVAVLRPKMPTRKLTLELVREVGRRLSVPKDVPSRRQPAPTSSAKVAGKPSSTAKPGTTSSPAHAT